jgi:glutaredoxin
MLDESNVEYEIIDLSENAEAMAMVKEMGYVSAPVVIAGNAHWSGFRHGLMLNAITEYRLYKVHAAA